MIIPSIDLMNGKAVQLEQGKTKKLEFDNVFELAANFQRFGDLAVIDLDAALEQGNNLNIIIKLCQQFPCRVGGGIRTVSHAQQLIKAGAKKIIIGTCADPDFLQNFLPEQIIIAIDCRNNKVLQNGWTKETQETPIERMNRLASYCSEFLFTDVEIEGLMKGPNWEKIRAILKNAPRPVTIAGSITTWMDVMQLELLEANSQIGMSLYTAKLELFPTLLKILDFEKGQGLIPTIVQDEEKNVLMLAYSSKESLQKTFQTNNAWYYSRSRQKLWQKGEKSGNTQQFIRSRFDCDRDTLLFTVKQNGFACHKQSYTCFLEKPFSINQLYEIIKDRIENPRGDSYTSIISQSEIKILDKIREEAQEVVNYENRENLIWEIADITFFLLMLMAKNHINPQEIQSELYSRRRK